MITHAFCLAFKKAILDAPERYFIALYTEVANLSKATEFYTTEGEVVGPGYDAGGQELHGREVTLDDDWAILNFSIDPSWPAATISARGALIYIAHSKLAVAVLDFGGVITSTNDWFRVALPAPTATSGLVRIR